jgi:phage repressor protein C with HTH and peptisase S24 domain
MSRVHIEGRHHTTAALSNSERELFANFGSPVGRCCVVGFKCLPGDFVNRITGNCMEPDWPDGADIVFRPCKAAEIRDGDPCFVFLKDRRATFKALRHDPRRKRRFILYALNSDFTDSVSFDDIKLVARAVHWTRITPLVPDFSL